MLARYRFELGSQRGSHRKWRTLEIGQLLLCRLGSQELPIGTLRQIMTAADIPSSAWCAQ
ncbi:MAG: type II toxin-antitoxin system HicA family toxin [Armatimonadota bacterium]